MDKTDPICGMKGTIKVHDHSSATLTASINTRKNNHKSEEKLMLVFSRSYCEAASTTKT